MKKTTILVSCLICFMSGCTTLSLEELEQTSLRYHSVHRGMTKEELLADLGAPKKVTGKRQASWEISNLSSGAWAKLDVTFDEKGVVERVRGSEHMPFKSRRDLPPSYYATLGEAPSVMESAQSKERFRRVQPGMKEVDAVAWLGTPRRFFQDAHARWTTWDPRTGDVTALDVWSDAQGTIRRVSLVPMAGNFKGLPAEDFASWTGSLEPPRDPYSDSRLLERLNRTMTEP